VLDGLLRSPPAIKALNEESVIEMSSKITGGCKCGNVRYECKSEKFGDHFCHCKDCQSYYGAPFGAHFIVDENQTIIHGTVASHSTPANSGNTRTHLFCSNCGTPVGDKVEEIPGVLLLAAGTLDNPELFQPGHHMWTASKLSWVKIDDDLPQIETQPEYG
jgi:hypothetical protein